MFFAEGGHGDGGTDRRTGDIGHYPAMTGSGKISVIPRSEATWESVFLAGQGPCALPGDMAQGERIATASVRTGLAMTRFFTRGAVVMGAGDREGRPYGGHGDLRMPGSGRRGRRPLRIVYRQNSVGADAHIGPHAPAPQCP